MLCIYLTHRGILSSVLTLAFMNGLERIKNNLVNSDSLGEETITAKCMTSESKSGRKGFSLLLVY